MIDHSTENKVANIRIELITSILLTFIAFMDSLVFWNNYVVGKAFTYLCKMLIFVLLPFIYRKGNRLSYLYSILMFPLFYITAKEDSLLLTLLYIFSAVIPVMAFFQLPKEYKIITVKNFILMNIFFYVIGFFFYVIFRYTELPHLNFVRKLDSRNYYNYFFLYFTNGSATYSYRFTSLWDEPGVIGTFCALVLFFFRKSLNRWQYLIIITAGIMSFSLFFIGVLIPILFFSNIRNWSLPKRIFMGMTFFLICTVSYIGFNSFAKTTETDVVLRRLIYNRFEWKNGWIVGINNNRDVIPNFDIDYKNFVEEGGMSYFFGNGKQSMLLRYGKSGLSYRIFIYEKGILILIYLTLIYFSFHNWSKKPFFSLVSMVFLCATFFQRPLLYNINFIALIYVGIQYGDQNLFRNVKIKNYEKI